MAQLNCCFSTVQAIPPKTDILIRPGFIIQLAAFPHIISVTQCFCVALFRTPFTILAQKLDATLDLIAFSFSLCNTRCFRSLRNGALPQHSFSLPSQYQAVLPSHAVITFFWRLGSLPEAGEDARRLGGIIECK